MAGRGRPPKPDNRKARGARKNTGETVLFVEPAEQPHLPQERDWPGVTRDWWINWGDHPMAETFTASDWHFLLDTALLHAAVWGAGDLRLLPELRLRVAKYGVTPEDRARLRIQFAEADAKDKRRDAPGDEVKANAAGSAARARYGHVHLVAVEDPAEQVEDQQAQDSPGRSPELFDNFVGKHRKSAGAVSTCYEG